MADKTKAPITLKQLETEIRSLKVRIAMLGIFIRVMPAIRLIFNKEPHILSLRPLSLQQDIRTPGIIH